MQISFDPTNQDERDIVASLLENLEGDSGAEAKTAKRTRKPKVETAMPSLPPGAIGVLVAEPAVTQPAPAFTNPAPAAAAAPIMPAMPSFLDRAQQAVAPAPEPVAAPAPVQSSGVTQIQVTQAIQAFTSRYKVAGAKQRLAEFAKAYGLPEKLSIDQIPQEFYAQAIDAFKVE